jgi:low temperature requirement protein LtrA
MAINNKKKLWQLPSIRTEGDLDLHRSVTWLELFFDLYFVVVIRSICYALSLNISFVEIKFFIIAFIPIWWIWIGATFYNERFETDGIEIRIFTFLLMIPVAGLAIFSYKAAYENLKYFLFSYAAARVIIIFLWTRAGYHSKIFRPTTVRYVTGFSISLILVIFAAIINSKISRILFPLALFIDLITPAFTIKTQRKLPRITTSKLPERFGLFTIIVLGEIVIGVIEGISNHHHFKISLLPIGVMGIATTLGFWWMYFDFIARRPFRQNTFFFWSYFHMPLLMTFTLIGSCLYNMIIFIDYPKPITITIYMSCLGIVFILIGLIELTLEKSSNEPIYQILSSGIKFITGIISICLGLFIVFDSILFIMSIGLILIFINNLYSLYICYNQKID